MFRRKLLCSTFTVALAFAMDTGRYIGLRIIILNARKVLDRFVLAGERKLGIELCIPFLGLSSRAAKSLARPFNLAISENLFDRYKYFFSYGRLEFLRLGKETAEILSGENRQ